MNTTIAVSGARARDAMNIAAAVQTAFAGLARELRIRRDVAFLMQQDDRLLRDIGLSRDNVAQALRGRS